VFINSLKLLINSQVGGKMSLKNLYLIVYNLLQTLGWTYVVYKSTKYFHLKIDNDSLELWHSVEQPLKVFQTVAIIEVRDFFVSFLCWYNDMLETLALRLRTVE